jgi:hypothetical protein
MIIITFGLMRTETTERAFDGFFFSETENNYES